MDVIFQTWWIFLPLFGLSVWALALALQKVWLFWNARDLPDADLESKIEQVGGPETAQALTKIEQARGPVAAQVRAWRQWRRASEPDLAGRLQFHAERLLEPWNRHAETFASVANLATLLGLFGTVSGMIGSFGAIQASGHVELAVVAGGIGQALVTTFAGLAVALPFLGFQSWWNHVLDRQASRLEVITGELLSLASRVS